MSGARACHRHAPAGSILAIVLTAGSLALGAVPSSAAVAASRPHGIRLPAPVREVDPLTNVNLNLRPDRLPMQVRLSLERPDGSSSPWDPAGRAPADGTAKVTLTNQTSSTRAVDTGRADLAPLVATIERLQAAAAHPRTAVPPAAGAGL